jgi:hypothetical protein
VGTLCLYTGEIRELYEIFWNVRSTYGFPPCFTAGLRMDACDSLG